MQRHQINPFINPIFWLLVVFLYIVLMVGIQSMIDGFFPFHDSGYVTLMVSWIGGLIISRAVGKRLQWLPVERDPRTALPTKITDQFKFLLLCVVLVMIFTIPLTICVSQVPVLHKHLHNVYSSILFLMPTGQISRYLGHKWGWVVVEYPAET